MSYTLAEVDFLTQHLPEIAGLNLEFSKASQLSDVAKLQQLYGENYRCVAELIKARRSGKLPADWLMDSDSAQQATPLVLAQYRRRFLQGLGVELVHDVTCSIGTEGHAWNKGTYIGSDLDASRIKMAQHNVDHPFFRADALTQTSTARVLIADPARRKDGKRITDPAKLLPPLPDLVAAHSADSLRIAHSAELAVKCAPGLDFSQWPGLVSVASVNGNVKEACLYTPGLATGRQAVLLKDGTEDTEGAEGTEGAADILDSNDFDEDNLPEAGDIGSYIIDPDGAVVRAGLVRHYAAREGLHQLDPRIAYLTGERIPAGTSGFPFIEAVPVKRLKAALQAHGAGSLEILVRGLNVDPDQLRKKLKLKGKRSMAIVMTRIGTQGIALLCGPRVVSSEDNYAT